MIDRRVVLACLFLAACGDDGDAAASDPGTTSPSHHSEDAGPVHGDADGGMPHSQPSAAGSSRSPGHAGIGGSGGSAGATVPAAGSGGKRGRPEAGSSGRGRDQAGGGGEGGRARPGNARGRAAAGSGGMASSPACPAAQPADGSACDGQTNLRCSYDAGDCRCRHSEPVWTCEMPKGKRGSAGAGGS